MKTTNVLDTYENGECVYFRNAAPVSWVQEEHLRKLYITYLNPNSEVPTGVPAAGAVRAVDPSIAPEQMAVLKDTDPFVIPGDKPVQRDRVYFTNDGGDMFVGMWDRTPSVAGGRPSTSRSTTPLWPPLTNESDQSTFDEAMPSGAADVAAVEVAISGTRSWRAPS